MKWPKLNEDERALAFVLMSNLLFPVIIAAIVGGLIGGCLSNSDMNVHHDELKDYASAVSNRLDRIEYALDRFVIPVQPKEESK